MSDKSVYFSTDRPELRMWMREFREPYVEVGCGEGQMLAHLKLEGRVKGRSIGIEINPVAAVKAKEVFDVIRVGDVQDNLVYFEGAGTIVCGDLLEHLVDPWDCLQSMVNRMKVGGKVYISIPNVAYWNVSWSLFWHGRFEYSDAGILDRTHLRFFTKNGICSMVENSGLEIVRIEGNMGLKKKKLNRWTFGRWDHLLAFQYFIEAVKRG
ncbi:MAG: class I SAM-dependent methyltransferase [Ghiorsea sp.]